MRGKHKRSRAHKLRAPEPQLVDNVVMRHEVSVPLCLVPIYTTHGPHPGRNQRLGNVHCVEVPNPSRLTRILCDMATLAEVLRMFLRHGPASEW